MSSATTLTPPQALPPSVPKKTRRSINKSNITTTYLLRMLTMAANEVMIVYYVPSKGHIHVPPISIETFELALDCCGSFLLHFSLDKRSPEGREGRELLMTILEPLLGMAVPYSSFLTGVNNYCQSRRLKESLPEMNENVQRFLEEARKGWKKGSG